MSGLLSRLASLEEGVTLAGGAVLAGDPVPDPAGARVPARGGAGEPLSVRFLDPALLAPGAAGRLAALAGFRHAAFVPVVAAGETDGIPYLVEHSQEGVTADRFLERARAEGKGAPAFFIVDPDEARGRTGNVPREPYWRAVCRIGIALGQCLEAFRGHGLPPTELDPGTILFRLDANPIFMALGLVGKPVEDPREEVGALGRFLWCLATLQPFGAEKFREPREAEPMMNEKMETILLAATAPAPADRYAGPGALARDLDLYLTHRPIAARRPGFLARLFGGGPRAG